MSGWFAIKRGTLEHEMFAPDGKFSKFEAWVWLIENAAYADVTIDLGGKPLRVKRGSLCFSLRFMAKKWRWGVKAVRVFLARLESHGAIKIEQAKTGPKEGTARTHITLCNYEKYQQAGHSKGTEGAQQGHKEEQGNKLSTSNEVGVASDVFPSEPSRATETDLFRFGRHVLGGSTGGVIAKLKRRMGSVPEAYRVLQEASTKAVPMEWVMGVIKRDVGADKLEAWGIGDAKPLDLGAGDWGSDPEEGSGEADLPRVQRGPEEEARSLPVGDDDDGRPGGPLLALRLVSGGVL